MLFPIFRKKTYFKILEKYNFYIFIKANFVKLNKILSFNRYGAY
jgi:hypothetical protein